MMDYLYNIYDWMERLDEGYCQRQILLNEGVESKNMGLAKHYLYDHKGCNEQEALRIIGAIKTDVPNVRLCKCKFILALTRMFCNGELSDGNIIQEINRTLRLIANDTHVNEYDNDLNGLSAQEIVNRFAGIAKADLEQDRERLAQQTYQVRDNYEIVKIYSFEEAEPYGDYTDWCVTHDERMLASYTAGGGVFYFCLREGYENEPMEVGENCPLDRYGLSMIAVSVNSDGSCNTITCRWNHSHGGNDHVMTPEDLSHVIGQNFYSVFKPLTPEEVKEQARREMRTIEYDVDMDYECYGSDVAEYATPLEARCGAGTVARFVYTSNGTYHQVLLDADADILTDTWFDEIDYRVGDRHIMVKRGDKYNVIDINGKLLTNDWADYFGFNSANGYYKLGWEGRGTTLLAPNGQWAGVMYNVIEFVSSYDTKHCDYANVQQGNKLNMINVKQPDKQIFPEWYDGFNSITFGFDNVLYAFKYGDVWKVQDRWTGKELLPYEFKKVLRGGRQPLLQTTDDKWYYLDTSTMKMFPANIG